MSFVYDQLADAYRGHRQCHEGVLRGLLAESRVIRNSSVAEVGVGTGNYAGALRKLTGCTCWGIDPSEAMLSVARSRHPDLKLVKLVHVALGFYRRRGAGRVPR